MIVEILFIQRDTNDHCCQKWKLFLLQYLQCLLEIISFTLWFVDIILKTHFKVTANLRSILYLSLVLSSCVKIN